jgi:hypothetical protein
MRQGSLRREFLKVSKTKTRTVKHGTGDIAAAMRKRYPSDAYALLFEVGNSTGFGCSRHADALAMSLWPSRGLNVLGFEFKASRTDWVKELNTPAKAEAIQRYCDQWWLVVADREFVRPGELPETWGMMAMNGRGLLDVVTAAPSLTPLPWPREFIAAVLRSAADPVAAIDNTALARAREEGRKAEADRNAATHKRMEDELTTARHAIATFENTTGVSITKRYGGISAREFKLALNSLGDRSFEDHVHSVRQVLSSLDRLREEFVTELTGIEKLARPVAEEVTEETA